jgi:hypothetical protein
MEDADVDRPLVVVFLRELTEQHNFAQTAYQGMRDKFEKVFAPNREMDPDAARTFWFFSQAFLSAVANISKILFPTQGGNQERGLTLRTLLGITDDSLFNSQNRAMRNHYEHFDERLDEWWTTSRIRGHADKNLYPICFLESEFGEENCFRNFDSKPGILTFMGQHFAIEPVMEQLGRLRVELERQLAA